MAAEPTFDTLLAEMRAALVAIGPNPAPAWLAKHEGRLIAHGPALAEKAWALHQWLVKADDWLEANPDAPDFATREDRWLERLTRYEEAMTVLGEALTVLGRQAWEPEPVMVEPVRQEAML